MRTAFLAILSSMSILTGCNFITGADGITVEGAAADAGAGASEGSGGPTVGAGGAASTTTAGAGAGGSVTTGPPPPTLASADGVTLDRVVVYQGVEREVMEGGNAVTSDVPVVAERDALVRVFYQADGSVPVTARLTIDGEEFTQEVTASGASSDSDLGSTVNFDVPASALSVGAEYRVDFLQPAEMTSGQNASAGFPSDGASLADMGVQKGGELHVVLVPIAYDGDGSGRLPDTSPGQLQAYEEAFFSMYPVEGVNLEVRDAVTWGSTVSPGGGGWSNLLNAIADLRAQDNVPFETYYYGIFSPASSFGGYCSGGCVSGLGFLGGPMDTFTRAAIGLGFSGGGSVDTAIHELGHNHGRQHAPCGNVSGADGNYPYSNGGIGSWGYDLLSGELFAPSQFADVMGYCNPTWISDYNFTALFDRVRAVASQSFVHVPAHLQNRTYERLVVAEDGTLEWLDPIQLDVPPLGETADVTVETTQGTQQASGHFLQYDHLDGGVLLVEPTAAPIVHAAPLTAQFAGRSVSTP